MGYYCTKKDCYCQMDECKTYKRYEYQQLPCPYRKVPECSFFNRLSELNGTKIRRQYFNRIICFELFVMIIPLLSASFLMLATGRKSISSFYEELDVYLVFIAIATVPFIVLGLLNRFAFGRIVCVLTDKGLCCNQWCISYEDIAKVEYFAEMNTKAKIYYNYAVIHTKDKEYKLPHAPLMLLRKLKKINPNIELSSFSRSVKDWLILYAIIMLLILIFEFIF